MTFAGAQAAAAGPFTSLSLVNTTLSYRMRVHGKLGQRLTLDTGLDVLSRVTTYEALVPDRRHADQLERASTSRRRSCSAARSTLGLGAYIDLGIDVDRSSCG